ncbi:MAG: AAA family ATPase [Candidatus Woesearchaeota archaeon]
MIITITGTPGTGKTYIAKKVAEKTNFRYLNLNKIIKKEKLYERYDKKAKTYDVEVKKLKIIDKKLNEYLDKKNSKITDDSQPKKTTLQKLIKELKNKKKTRNIIIDSHLSHYLKSDLCIVVKSDIKKISERLKKRKYSIKKIRENIESEIFDVCLEEAKQQKRNIVILYN